VNAKINYTRSSCSYERGANRMWMDAKVFSCLYFDYWGPVLLLWTFPICIFHLKTEY